MVHFGMSAIVYRSVYLPHRLVYNAIIYISHIYITNASRSSEAATELAVSCELSVRLASVEQVELGEFQEAISVTSRLFADVLLPMAAYRWPRGDDRLPMVSPLFVSHYHYQYSVRHTSRTA